jgi:hypothetical protein
VVPFDTAMDQWQAGLRRLSEAPPEQRATLERVTRGVEDELRRRLGGPFMADELVELYDRDGTGWCTDLAVQLAPDRPYAWDERIVGDAAFGRYVREAGDFAGGRRLVPRGGR